MCEVPFSHRTSFYYDQNMKFLDLIMTGDMKDPSSDEEGEFTVATLLTQQILLPGKTVFHRLCWVQYCKNTED